MLLPAEFQPHAMLRPYVKCYWTITGQGETAGVDGQAVPPKQFLPDCGLKLSFNLASPALFLLHSGRKLRTSHGAVCGALTTNYWVHLDGEVNSMGVQFHPGGAYPFMALPMDSLTDAIYDLDQVWGASGRRLTAAIHRPWLNTLQRLELLEAFLLRRLVRFHKRDAAFEYAARVISAHQGRVSLSVLCRQLGVSQRQLERKFHHKCGMTPKRLCSVLRFRRLFEYISSHPNATWADTALCCGYYDQAHLIRDFNLFTGMSPARFIREIVQQDRLINWGYDMDALARFGQKITA